MAREFRQNLGFRRGLRVFGVGALAALVSACATTPTEPEEVPAASVGDEKAAE